MKNRNIYPAEMTTKSLGKFSCNVYTANYKPIEDVSITIKESIPGEKEIDVLKTNMSGKTEAIELDAPPIDYSLEPNNPKPYSEYILEASATGFEPVRISGTQILGGEFALQDIVLEEEGKMMSSQNLKSQATREIVIQPHTLYAEYPPKIPEAEVKEFAEQPGFIVLNKVVVPEIIVVHDGSPNNSAKKYYVQFKNYIKNVASSEIYATWPESTIQSNVLAILSFTLNRVFTEWYRGKGKNFTITSSTAFDQKWMYGRNIYKNIAAVVDSLFINYISRPGIEQPLFTQYCDGIHIQCPNWMTQWGSKFLGDSGSSAIEILRHFYGSDVYINTAPKVSGIPSSFPGYNFQIGSRGEPVRVIQKQLNAIAKNYPAIPKLKVDGIFGPKTQASVKKFQEVFDMPVSGIVDYPTWYRISHIFVAVTRMAELF